MKKYKSFNSIAKEIISNKKFLTLKNESHHGMTRYDHSMNVARAVYKYAIKFNLDYIHATRAAILHDFFRNSDFINQHGLIQGVVHPDIAVANAKGEFELNEMEENMIESHMFPLCATLPRYKEAWLLTCIDKMQATFEYLTYKWNYRKVTNKLGYSIGCVLLFMFFMLTTGRE